MYLRRAASFVVLTVLAAFTVAAPPAWAAPAQVKLVSFVGASTTSLKLSWPHVSGATGYEIFRSVHTDMSGFTRVRISTGTSVTVTGMTPGTMYCFQVRGTVGSAHGMLSPHTCKPTIRAQVPISGAAFAVMTLNTCSQVCSGWSSRVAAAKNVVASRNPDVIAAQEAGLWTTPPPGYANAFYRSAKRLFYKTSRFSLASGSNGPRAGAITLSTGKYAVWAELIERSTGKRIIFVSAHATSALADYPLRGLEIQTLLAQMGKINTAGRPVVYAGDFNSHKNRGTYSESVGFGAQDTVGRTFAAAGYYDCYDLARTLKRPNWNSYSGFKTTPTISYTWGDHVDHVYVKPTTANVYRWMNAALYSGNSYATPMPSDHSGVQVDLYVR
jgi:endonuclease/exonuclease/phosphatase family metal-dependent hydrolase